MANSELEGKYWKIEPVVLTHLIKVRDSYDGDQTVEGYPRLKNLCDKKIISYGQTKRIKNFFDTYDGDGTDITFILNGGDLMKKWINHVLDYYRDALNKKKQSMSDIGMPNQHIKSHEKDGLPNVQKPTIENDISAMKGFFNLITENKNTLKR